MLPRLLLPLTVAAALLGATPALAAVPVGDDGSLRPRDGAELLEAVTLATTSGPGRPNPTARIVLGEGTYAIDRPIVLGDAAGDAIIGASSGNTRITGTGAATTLLRLTGTKNQASKIALEPTGAGTYPVAQLAGGASLADFLLMIPEELPAVTAIATTGHATISGGEIESGAGVPAVVADGSVDLRGGTSIVGGGPALDLRGAGAASTSIIDRASLRSFGDGGAVVRARAGSAAAKLRIQSSTLQADVEGTTIVDLRGAATAAGHLDLDLASATLAGPPDSTAVGLTAGAERAPTTASLTGLLSLRSATTVACAAAGTAGPATVRITGVSRAGTLSAAGCTVTESGRVDGDPGLVTPDGPLYVPRWDSPLVDRIAAPAGVDTDAYGQPRTSTGPRTPTATPSDIGAVEYQYVAPAIDDLLAEPTGTDGTVRFSVAPPEVDPEIAPDALGAITFTWTFPGGQRATGTEVTHRFESATPGDVIVTATHANGMTATETVRVTIPGFVGGPGDGATGGDGPSGQDGAAPDPAPREPDATPPPTTPGQQQTLPDRTALPTPSSTPRPQQPLAEAAPTLRRLQRVRPAVRAGAARPSGVGAARSTEARVDLDLGRPAAITVIAARRSRGRLVRLRNARLTFDAPAGSSTLHLSTRIGKATLQPGLHRVTILIRPATGSTVRRDLYVRVARTPTTS